MAENGKPEQQPGAGKAAEVAVETNADTLEALIEQMDVQPKAADSTAQKPAAEDQKPEGDDPKPTEEAGEPEKAEPEHEEEAEEAHKEIFTPEAYKIFKERIGKEKGKREKIVTELEAVREELAQAKKSSDPVLKEAVTSSGIDPEFLSAETAKTIADAEKLNRQIAWLRDASKSPDGFETADGKVYTQAEIAAHLSLLVSDPDNMATLTEARIARKSALALQKEAIAEGLKVIKAREAAAKALKSGAAKPKDKTAPPAPSGASTQPGHAASRRDFSKTGNLDDLIDAI